MFHAGGDEFKDLKLFTEALEARYGRATGVEDYARKAQALAYEGQRAMFEAFGRNKYDATGVIQWMLNNAWPSMIWHLYDYYLRPGGGYFGTKKACEPLHVQYSYDDSSVAVVNDRHDAVKGLSVTAQVLDLDLRETFSKTQTIDVPADGVVRAFSIPPQTGPGPTTTYFVRLTLEDAESAPVSTNFYWLSTSPDELDWAGTKWYYTPTRRHADLTALTKLPSTTLAVTTQPATSDVEDARIVVVENTGSAMAFLIHLKLVDAESDDELLPVFWDANYFELLPGEKRTIRVAYPRRQDPRRLMIEAEAWNVPRARYGIQ
jgi:exo-1,4-beta-D-glucosaminidase